MSELSIPAPLPASDSPVLDLRAMLQCEHERRVGGNDYILCHDCGLMWDYRRDGITVGALRELARLAVAEVERLRALHASIEAAREPTGWYCGCGHPNGINLAECACCTRKPGGPENHIEIIYRTPALHASTEAHAKAIAEEYRNRWKAAESAREATEGALRQVVERFEHWADCATRDAEREREVGARLSEAHQRGMAEAFKGATNEISALLALPLGGERNGA